MTPAEEMAARRRDLLKDVRQVRQLLAVIEQEYERAKSDTEHMRWDKDYYRHKLEGAEARLARLEP